MKKGEIEMNTKRFDGFLVWVLVVVILAVAAVLLLATVKPAGAASVCGPTVGPAGMVETALNVAGIPVLVRERVTKGTVSCAGTTCPKPKPGGCLGWSFIIRTAGQGYMVGRTWIPARFVEFWFDKNGKFDGAVR
jgi:hypothetical protein